MASITEYYLNGKTYAKAPVSNDYASGTFSAGITNVQLILKDTADVASTDRIHMSVGVNLSDDIGYVDVFLPGGGNEALVLNQSGNTVLVGTTVAAGQSRYYGQFQAYGHSDLTGVQNYYFKPAATAFTDYYGYYPQMNFGVHDGKLAGV